MRWENLFDDLESQLEQGLSAEEVDLRAEEERLRLGRLVLRDRLIALHAVGSDIQLVLANDRHLVIRPIAFGRDWMSGTLVEQTRRHPQCILPIAAIAALILPRDLVAASIEMTGSADDRTPKLSERLGLPFVLRDLCRRRSSVQITTRLAAHHGTIDRVGRDHLDLAVHATNDARRESAVTQYRVVPFDQVLLLQM
ncbi:hypothetical protein [Salinibacterium sp. ZJ450]|uniref:hypothetical protein n=1 Tax=Salinibacterium sp. ZJ450 TaxID=2708338 RepID=UPI0014207459|nr:hypothetical protein [Salinibacterium sp. ZJ450]